MTVGETVSAMLVLENGDFFSEVRFPSSTPQVITAVIHVPSSNATINMPDPTSAYVTFGDIDFTITAENIGTKIISHANSSGTTDYSIVVTEALPIELRMFSA
jgi:hypothetical protein